MSESNADLNVEKMVKSELYHVWKKARMLYDMINVENCPEWAKSNIRQAHDLIDEAMRYEEYSNLFPDKPEEPEDKNNFLSNEDKRYPAPVAGEGGDTFVTRCILDANMKKRYPVQSDRFSACMLIYSDQKAQANPEEPVNPGKKFGDPMKPNEPEIEDPEKPMLP